MSVEETEPVNNGGVDLQDTIMQDAPAPAELKYLSKEEFFNNKVAYIREKIGIYKILQEAYTHKIQVLLWGTTIEALPLSEKEQWADLKIALADVESVIYSLEFEEFQIVGNLNRHLKELEVFGKEMEDQWDNKIAALKDKIAKLRMKGTVNTVQLSNTLIQANEPFAHREDKIDFYRMLVNMVDGK